MAHIIDWLVTGSIVLISSVLTIRYLVKLVHPPKHLQATCIACDTGCEMREIRDDFIKKKRHLVQTKN